MQSMPSPITQQFIIFDTNALTTGAALYHQALVLYVRLMSWQHPSALRKAKFKKA
jgi:hypothetical protein